MKKRRLAVVVALGGTLAVLGACGSEDRLKDEGDTASTGNEQQEVTEVKFPLEIADSTGAEHTFKKPVTKPGIAEGPGPLALAELGVKPWADSNPRQVVEELGELFYPKGPPVHMGLDFEDPEAWVKTGVEVIFVPGPALAWNKALRRTGKVFFLRSPDLEKGENPDGAEIFYENYRTVGQILGRPEAAEKVIDRFESFLAELKSHAPEGAADNEIQLLNETKDGTYFLPMQPDSAFCKLLEENEMGRCIAPPDWNEETWQVNAESLLAENPDWIGYVRDIGEGSHTDRDDPVWKRLDAVKKGQVFDLEGLWNGLASAQWFLQKYAHEVWGEEGGIPNPVRFSEYRPTDSPLDNAAR